MIQAFRPWGSWPDWQELLRLHRPVGYWLLLWPTLWGLFAASHGHPDIRNLSVFVAGVILMRSTGCVINDYADRRFDQHVARTRTRPIAAGRISPAAALFGFFFMLLTALLLVLQTSLLVVQLAFIGVALAAIYPFLKRVTNFPQAWLGLAFGWGTIMAWAAETGNISDSPVPWLLFLANIFWSLSYDTAYAIGDRMDDQQIGVKSTALWFGKHTIAAIFLFGLLMLASLALASLIYGGFAWLGWMLCASWQAWLFLNLFRQKEAWSFQFFLLSHWSGALMCIGFLVPAIN